jgi:Holliday junction resolvase RusA-like endonuclease
MPKPRRTLKFRLPEYVTGPNKWKKLIHGAALEAKKKQKAEFPEGVQLQVEVRVYLKDRQLGIHDVDNRLKSILDALQGRAGGSKAVNDLEKIIQNDQDVYRVVIEKSAPPKQSRGLGHVKVSLLRTRKG